jgi:hypothetical protein
MGLWSLIRSADVHPGLIHLPVSGMLSLHWYGKGECHGIFKGKFAVATTLLPVVRERRGLRCHGRVADNFANLKKQGRSRDETVAAKPTAAFDAKWGQFVIDPGFFTRLVYEGV